jgi:hypothetical protein
MPHFRLASSENVIFLRTASRQSPGLTVAETIEFETLDALAPFDEHGQIAWFFEGLPISERERRWLALFNKIR